MNKIICDVCGTDYPETAAQCPICGCASAGAQTSVGSDTAEAEEKNAYAPVKGGRYSKANVRKRLKENQIPYDPIPESDPEPEYEDDGEQEEQEEEEEPVSNRGLIAVVIILLLAIVAVAAYIAVSIFGFGTEKPQETTPNPETVQTAPTTEPTTETTPVATDVACTALELSDVDISLTSVGSVWQLTATPVPADTTDEVVFTSTDENVVTVDKTGLVTAVASGQASITVTCGEITVDCPVLCKLEEEETTAATEPTETEDDDDDFVLKLKSKDFTLKKAGETYKLYNGEVDAAEITWSSGNEEVATVENGIVTAVGSGRTQIYAKYNGQKVSCWVSCRLPEEEVTEPTEEDVTTAPEEEETTAPEDEATNNASYRMLVDGRISPYGDAHNAEVTITVEEEFRLTVEDEAGVRQNVTWKASKDGICTVDGRTVIGESKGKVTLTATIGDQTFKCIIIVK